MRPYSQNRPRATGQEILHQRSCRRRLRRALFFSLYLQTVSERQGLSAASPGGHTGQSGNRRPAGSFTMTEAVTSSQLSVASPGSRVDRLRLSYWQLTTDNWLPPLVVVIALDDAADGFAGGGKLDAVEEFVRRQLHALALRRPALDVRRPGVVSGQRYRQGVRLVTV